MRGSRLTSACSGGKGVDSVRELQAQGARLTRADSELPLIRQYRAWLRDGGAAGDSPREAFFQQGLVVLDTNVLLNLYQYTPSARDDVLGALEKVKPRLWLPYQVGLEFVQGRHRVVAKRADDLKKGPQFVNQKLQQAQKSVLEAAKHVQDLLVRYAQDTEAKEALQTEITGEAVNGLLKPWCDTLLSHIETLKRQHDVLPGAPGSSDPVLPPVAELYGSRVAEPPGPGAIRERVTEAHTYRFPNQIPPGFSDGGKETALQSAGDYLLWEEVIERARQLDSPRLVLLVSADTKEDWYQPAEGGRSARPWPSLADEMRSRADADLRFETPQQFFQGIREFLDATIADATYEEIERTVEAADGGPEENLGEDSASLTVPPEGAALSAYRAAGLTTSAVRDALESPSHRAFQWWLMSATADAGRRLRGEGEARADYPAACFSGVPPAPYWEPGSALAAYDWPRQPASWVAPWFAQLLRSVPQADRSVLRQLALKEARAAQGRD